MAKDDSPAETMRKAKEMAEAMATAVKSDPGGVAKMMMASSSQLVDGAVRIYTAHISGSGPANKEQERILEAAQKFLIMSFEASGDTSNS
jgi:hypothetical protein